jgi:hypothetical protein
MNTTNDVASATFTKLIGLLPEWLELELRRRERDSEIESWEKWPQGFKPWTQGREYDKNRLGELYEERRRHEELTDRLTEAEYVLFRFGDARGIDTDLLRRLLKDGDLKCADAIIPLLRRLYAALDRESEGSAGGKQPSPTKLDNKPTSETAGTLVDEGGEGPAEPLAGMTWQDAAERMKRLRAQGEPWTSQHKLAKQFGCSSRTIHKAIQNTPELKSWAKQQTEAAPKAQSLTPWKRGEGHIDVVTDRTPDPRALIPEDEVAIREYLERDDLKPEERAFFNSLSRNGQLDFLNDPDRHQQIRRRKP